MCKEKLGFIAIKLLMLLMLFGLVSCEDEIMELENVSYGEQSGLKMQDVFFDDYHQLDDNVQGALDVLYSEKKGGVKAKSHISSLEDYPINFTKYRLIEDGNYHSYTFSLDSATENEMQNLVLSERTDGGYDIYRISYDFSSDYIVTNSDIIIDQSNTTVEALGVFDGALFEDTSQQRCVTPQTIGQDCVNLDTCNYEYLHIAGAECNHINGSISICAPVVFIDYTCGGSSTGSNGSNVPTGGGGGPGNSNPGSVGIPTSPVGTVDLGFVLDLGYNFGSPAFEYIGDDNGNYLARSFVTRNGGGSIAEDKLRNVLSVLISNESPDSLTTIEEHKLYIGIQTNYISNQHLDLEDLYEAFKPENIDPDGILSLTDYLRISQSALDIRNLATLGVGGDLAIRKTIIKHTILSSIKSIYENNLPQTAEEWEAVGSIVGSAILEIAPDLIPGVGEVRDALRGIEALDNGDYWAAAENISFAIAGIIPVGKLLKGIGKVGKAVYKSSKVIRALWGVLTEVGVALNRGFNVILESSQIFLKRNGDVIAQGDDAVKAFFKAFGTRIDDAVVDIAKVDLPPSVANTFTDGAYRTVKTSEPVSLNRAFGGDAKLNGGFATTKVDATRSELALLDEWNNTMRFEAKIDIPSQQTLNIGKVAPQTSSDGLQTLVGGGDQILMPLNWDAQNWVDEIIDKTTGNTYTYEQFVNAFPNLIN